MTNNKEEYILLELSPECRQQDIMNSVKSLKTLESIAQRVGQVVEHDLSARLFVYKREGNRWKAEPQIKKIYKIRKMIPPLKHKPITKPKLIVKSLKKQQTQISDDIVK